MVDETFYNFNKEKNKWLLKERKITFEIVISILDTVGPLDIIKHYNQNDYSSQRMYVIAFEGYAYLVPFVENSNEIFLKTIFPSRKMTRQYLNKAGEAYDE